DHRHLVQLGAGRGGGDRGDQGAVGVGVVGQHPEHRGHRGLLGALRGLGPSVGDRDPVGVRLGAGIRRRSGGGGRGDGRGGLVGGSGGVVTAARGQQDGGGREGRPTHGASVHEQVSFVTTTTDGGRPGYRRQRASSS